MASTAQDKRHQRMLEEVLQRPGNGTCADCKAVAPRWASINLGVFLCVNCASVHRKMGTHRSRVKSVTLDSWTRDQITAMRNMGNTASNAIWNPDETKFPPPASLSADDRDSELEKYIRRKYEQGAFKAGGQGKFGPAPTSLNRARESDGRLPLGSVTGPGARGITLPAGENKRNPELNDVLVRRPSNSNVERDLPALPVEAKAATLAPPRPRPTRSSSAATPTTPASATSASSPFGIRGHAPVNNGNAQAPLVTLNGGLSSTRPLQLNAQAFGQSTPVANPGFTQPLGSANPFGAAYQPQAQPQYGQSAFTLGPTSTGSSSSSGSLAPPQQYGMSSSAPTPSSLASFDPLAQQQQQSQQPQQPQQPQQHFVQQTFQQPMATGQFQPQQAFVSPSFSQPQAFQAQYTGMNGMNGMNGINGMNVPFNNGLPHYGMTGMAGVPQGYPNWGNAQMAGYANVNGMH